MFTDDYSELKHANVLRLLSDDEEDRATKVFEALDPDTLKDLNEEEIAHIKELIREQPHIFGLPGEKKMFIFILILLHSMHITSIYTFLITT